MPSIICSKCGAKKANRPGKLCFGCWTLAGKPTTEEVRQLLVKQNAIPLPDEDYSQLPDDPTETDVQAMEALWLQQGRPKTVRQRAWMPLYQESPKAFRDRLDRIRGGRGPSDPSGLPDGSGTSSGVVDSWNGIGPCPTCHRPPDPYAGKTHEQLDDLLEKEFARVAAFDGGG